MSLDFEVIADDISSCWQVCCFTNPHFNLQMTMIETRKIVLHRLFLQAKTHMPKHKLRDANRTKLNRTLLLIRETKKEKEETKQKVNGQALFSSPKNTFSSSSFSAN